MTCLRDGDKLYVFLMRTGKILPRPHGGRQMFLLKIIWRNSPEASQVKPQSSYFVKRYIGIYVVLLLMGKSLFILFHPINDLSKDISSYPSLR